MSSLEENLINLYEYKNSSKDFVLTEDGYNQYNNSKDGFFNKVKNYATDTFNTYKQIGETALKYNQDIGTGMMRGGAKLAEGVGSLGMATLEKLDLVSNNSVQEFGEYFKNNIYPNIGDTETMAGGFAEGLTQYMTPGVGYYKLFNGILQSRKILGPIVRGLMTEGATVATAQVAGDPNLVGFFVDVFKVDKTQADSMAKEFVNWLATPEEDYTADSVFEEKIKSIIADGPIGPVGEFVGPALTLFGKIFKKGKNDPEVMQEFKSLSASATPEELKDGYGSSKEYFDKNEIKEGVDVASIKEPNSTVKLTQKETDYISSLIKDGEIYEYAPSLKIENGNLLLHTDDVAELDKFFDEVTNLEFSSVGGSGANTIPPNIRNGKVLDKILKNQNDQLNLLKQNGSLAVNMIIENQAIEGTGKIVKATNKNKVMLDDVINYFDTNQKTLDIKNPDDYKTIVNNSVEEINYQLDQEVTGAGWYDKDVNDAMSMLDDYVPVIKEQPILKELVPFFTAIASPGTPVGSDWAVAVKLLKQYADTGTLPKTNPETGLGWTRRPHLKTQLEFTEKFIEQYGLKQFLLFLETPTTVKEVNAMRTAFGFNKMAGAMNKEILGADMFGPKVGPFMKNLKGLSDNNVPDIWFTRGFNRKAGNMYITTKDGVKSNADQPRNNAEREIMNQMIKDVSEIVGFNMRDTQAILWYFEQGLYTKLGVKSEPKSYADVTRKIIEGKANDSTGSLSTSAKNETIQNEGLEANKDTKGVVTDIPSNEGVQ